MSQDLLGKFDSGASMSQTAERTGKVQDVYIRRATYVGNVFTAFLNILGLLPEHYANSIDFNDCPCQFKTNRK